MRPVREVPQKDAGQETRGEVQLGRVGDGMEKGHAVEQGREVEDGHVGLLEFLPILRGQRDFNNVKVQGAARHVEIVNDFRQGDRTSRTAVGEPDRQFGARLDLVKNRSVALGGTGRTGPVHGQNRAVRRGGRREHHPAGRYNQKQEGGQKANRHRCRLHCF